MRGERGREKERLSTREREGYERERGREGGMEGWWERKNGNMRHRGAEDRSMKAACARHSHTRHA